LVHKRDRWGSTNNGRDLQMTEMIRDKDTGGEENDIHNDLSTNICCPICYQHYECGYTEDYREGSTYDCRKCNGLLLFQFGHVLNFHKYQHYSSEGLWPIAGEDSGFIGGL